MIRESQIPPDARRARASILYRDRFVRVIFREGAEVGLEDAKDCLRIGIELHASNGAPCLVDLRYCRAVSAEARAHLAGPTGIRIAPAVAIVVSSPLSRTLGNFYLGFNKPKVPTRLFSSSTPRNTGWKDFSLLHELPDAVQVDSRSRRRLTCRPRQMPA